MGGGKKTSFQKLPKLDQNNPFDRDFAYRSTIQATYCQHCGKQLLTSSQDEFGAAVDWEWEMRNKAHKVCNDAFLEEQRAKARREEEERAKAAASFDWNDYMEKMTKRED